MSTGNEKNLDFSKHLHDFIEVLAHHHTEFNRHIERMDFKKAKENLFTIQPLLEIVTQLQSLRENVSDGLF